MHSCIVSESCIWYLKELTKPKQNICVDSSYTADPREAGEGDISCKVSYAGSEIPSYIVRDANGEYKVDFTPQGAGQYKVNVFMNEMEVRGQWSQLVS